MSRSKLPPPLTQFSLSRAADPKHLVGNPARARRELGWEPKTRFADLIGEMTAAALKAQ